MDLMNRNWTMGELTIIWIGLSIVIVAADPISEWLANTILGASF